MRASSSFSLPLTFSTAAAQSSQTCQGLETLASNADSSLSCARDDQCTQLMCNISGELAPFLHSTKVELLPCIDPPGIRLQLTNTSSVTIVNESITTIRIIPVHIYFAQQFRRFLGNINVMVNSSGASIGLEVLHFVFVPVHKANIVHCN